MPQFGVTSVIPDPQGTWSIRKRGVYAAFGSIITLSVVGLIAHVAHESFLFPSLGPTAFIVFFAAEGRQASPRNVVCGQLVGVGAGIIAVLSLGLSDDPVDLDDITFSRLIAVLVAITLTIVVMTWLGVEHAPAAATTLIIALGVIRSATGYVSVMGAIVVIVVLAFVINRAFRLPYPVWSPRKVSGSSL